MSSSAQTSSNGHVGTMALWASLLVLVGLVVVQLGRVDGGRSLLGPSGEARADVVSTAGDYTSLTFNAGNEDVLVVMDGRGESLFVYRVRNQNTVEFLDRLGLTDLFESARRIGSGRDK